MYNRCTNEEDDGVDDGENFEDVVRRARLPRRHRLPIEGGCAIIRVLCHRHSSASLNRDKSTIAAHDHLTAFTTALQRSQPTYNNMQIAARLCSRRLAHWPSLALAAT